MNATVDATQSKQSGRAVRTPAGQGNLTALAFKESVFEIQAPPWTGVCATLPSGIPDGVNDTAAGSGLAVRESSL